MTLTPETTEAGPLEQAERIVIKVGSLMMFDPQGQTADHSRIATLAEDIALLVKQGKQIILVSSGAVTLGRPILSFDHHKLSLTEKQAAAACGQILLAQAWQQALGEHGLRIGQLLVTGQDTEHRRRYVNMRNTIDTLLEYGVIPVVNEHDSISTEEIRYGDNDRLAARVAAMAGADLLVLLSDIDGLYTADPKANPAAQHIPRIDVLDDTIYNMAGETRDHRSSGGMKTKLQAAEIATSAGCQMLIALGMMSHPIRHIMQGGRFSWFTSHETPLSARKHWIANPATIRGKLTVDAGAVTALMAGRSLLPSGIRAIEGDFDRGDTVSVMTPEGEELARGLTGYPATDVKRIAGRHSDDGQQILGYIGPKEVIHRDDMVLLS